MLPKQDIEATLAFVFNKKLDKVLLIKKAKPIQHAGLLNGLGGKLEKGETHLKCIVREIEEEAGFTIKQEKWNQVGLMHWAHWKVSVWTSIYDLQTKLPTTFPENEIAWYPVKPLPQNVIENLHWLVPLSIDINQKILNLESSVPTVEVIYTQPQ